MTTSDKYPIERWVKTDGKWVHIVFGEFKTYIDGKKCEYIQYGIDCVSDSEKNGMKEETQ